MSAVTEGLDKHLAVWALMRATHFVELLIEQGSTEHRSGIHLVILQVKEDGSIGWKAEKTVGTLDDSHDYRKIAKSKAALTAEHRKPTDQIPLFEREPGATIYHGSVWNDDYSYVVAGSGFQAYFDRLVCQYVDALIINELGDPVDLGRPADGLTEDGDFLIRAS